MPSRDLDGVGVLVTRPRHQADGLCALIEQKGGRAIRFPTLEIKEPRDIKKTQTLLRSLSRYDLAIFISPNAVLHAQRMLKKEAIPFPDRLMIAVVGRSTAQAVSRALHREPDICPESRFDSEGLLATDALAHVRDRRIIIFKGEGGRDLLAEGLRERGAHVDYAEVYRRSRPGTAPDGVLQALDQGLIQVVTATSNEALRNLCDMLGGCEDLLQTPVAVVSQRGATLARQLGFRHAPIIADGAADQALVDVLVDWAAKNAKDRTLGTR